MLKLDLLYRTQRVALYTLFGCLSIDAAYAEFLEESNTSIYLRNADSNPKCNTFVVS